MPNQSPAQLGQSFFLRPTLKVAESLLGKLLIRRLNDTLLVGKIVETEAYCGADDLACHASRGKTPRTAIMFGPGGYWYIYLIYGIHHCLNIVTERENYPAAVLIRAVAPLQGFTAEAKTNGPGKLCKAYQLTRELNGLPQAVVPIIGKAMHHECDQRYQTYDELVAQLVQAKQLLGGS